MLSPGIWYILLGLIIFVCGLAYVGKNKNKAPHTDVEADEEEIPYSNDWDYVQQPVEDVFHDLGIQSEKPKVEKVPKKVAKKKAPSKKKVAKKAAKKTLKPKK